MNDGWRMTLNDFNIFFCLLMFQDDKKKKKASNKVIELLINPRTHGFSQAEFDKYFELEVSFCHNKIFDDLKFMYLLKFNRAK